MSGKTEGLWLEFIKTRDLKLRERLIEIYMPLVKIIANKLSISLPAYVDRDDCISDGYIGLIQAVDRFDPSLGYKFETFASIRIKGAIIDSLRAKDWLPTVVRQKVKKYHQTVFELECKLGRSVEDREIANELNISGEDFSALLKQVQVANILSLEEFSKICDLQVDNISEQLERQELIKDLATVIETLTEKEKLVISLYYYEELTLKEISYIMKLSEARISQIHTKAVFTMRGRLLSLMQRDK